ncbi:hypothetical protein ACHAXR_009745 [Thalassiosira sp. AJA248-18]
MTDSTTNSTNDDGTITTIPDHFDPEDIEDSTNPYPHPLSLVHLPLLPCQQQQQQQQQQQNTTNADNAVIGGDILAYGGDDGCIYLLSPNNNSNDKKPPRKIRQYDDCIKSIAISPDALRISIGFDIGSTKIYSYDDYNTNLTGNDNEEEEEGHRHHPFIPNNDEELSQADGLSQQETNSGIKEFDGPRMDASVRQLAFDPRSGISSGSSVGGNKGARVPYYLAIASESGNQPLTIVNATNDTTVEKAMYLQEKSGDEHEGNGVRSVAYSTVRPPSSTSSEGNTNDNNVLLATLGMDGKLVTWDVSSSDDPSLLWDVCHRDYNAVVPKEKMSPDNDSGDKACCVLWDGHYNANKGSTFTTAVLFLPGRAEVQYRTCPTNDKGEALSTEQCKQHLKGPPKFIVEEDGGGHKDGIVAMAVPPPSTTTTTTRRSSSSNSKNRLVTGGRDGKLFLWNLSLSDGTGSARELPLSRLGNTVGIPPVTSIVWCEEEEVTVAFADGTVATVPIQHDGVEKEASAGEKASGGEEARDAALDEESDEEANDRLAEAVMKSGELEGVYDDSDDDDMFNEDALPPTHSSSSKKQNDDNDDGGQEEEASKEKAIKFIDDEADDGGDDDDDADVQYDDAIKPTDKANGDPVNDNTEQQQQQQPTTDFNGDDDDDADMEFDNHNDPLDFTDTNPNPPTDPSTTNFHSSIIPLQPAFAPSSTPFGEPRRILCWNHVGVVTLRSNDTGDGLNLVDIAFHETAGLVGGRRPVTLTDYLGFIVGTVGEEGGLFASDVQEEEEEEESDDDDYDLDGLGVMSAAARRAVQQEKKKRKKELKEKSEGGGGGGAKGSRIHFQRFETFGRTADKNWRVDLPDGERVLGCATGGGWAAVITSRRFLRLFTISGIQGPVIWIPGEPVTVVGRDRFIAVFYHRSIAPMQDGTQLLGYSIIDGLTGATVASGDVSALSPASELSWAGFSDKCALSVMDSDGVLSMLSRHPTANSNGPSGGSGSNNGNWMPMLDTVGLKKSSSDSFWPVEVHGGKLVCIPLRGGRDHPDAARRPVTTTLGLRMPMATGLNMKCGPVEEKNVRAIFALNQEKVLDDYLVSQGEANEDEIEEEYNQKCLQVDRLTLTLFKTVVQAGKVERGFDLIRRLHNEKSYDVAIQMADRVGHRKLSDRIEEVKFQRFPPLDEEEEDGFDDDAASFDSGMRSERSSGSFEEEPVVATRQQRLEMLSQRISPEGGGVRTPCQQRHSTHDDGEAEDRGYATTDEESPPRESLKRKFEQDDGDAALDPVVSKKPINPFAKKKLESPAKGIMKVMRSPAKLSLSRASTFSAKSRQKQRSRKQIM